MTGLNVGFVAILGLVVRVSTLQGNITCGGKAFFSVDGAINKWLGDAKDTSPSVLPATQVQIADDGKVLSILCWGLYKPHGFLGSFDNGLVTDSSWRCFSTYRSDNWDSEPYDDSQWNDATVLGANGDEPWGNIEGVSSTAKWIWDGDNAFVICRKAFPFVPVVEEVDGEVTPEGCKYRGVVHPAGETWIQEDNVDPQRQRECTCPDPLPATWSASSGGCIAASMKEDVIVHRCGDQYQHTVDGAGME